MKPFVDEMQMGVILDGVARGVVRLMGIRSRGEVGGSAVDWAYDILWGNNELKFATEMYVDAGKVESALRRAAAEVEKMAS